MSDIISRLEYARQRGEILDGDRRYLLMRPDVLMGMLHDLDDTTRANVLSALARSAYEHGGRSINAYSEDVSGTELLNVICDTSAALGWGRWHVQVEPDRLRLLVQNSPFAWGHGSSSCPVCAPIVGILKSVAGKLLGESVTVDEVVCGATAQGQACEFVAYREMGNLEGNQQ